MLMVEGFDPSVLEKSAQVNFFLGHDHQCDNHWKIENVLTYLGKFIAKVTGLTRIWLVKYSTTSR